MLPQGYEVVRYLYAPSRWIVTYKGDPFFFVKKVNALGEERITTFATKRAAEQAAIDHEAMIARLEAQTR